MAGAGAVDAQQDLDRFDVRGGDLRDGLLGDSDLVGGVVRAGVPGAQLPGQRLTGLVRIGEHRREPVATLERARGLVLLRMRGDQRGVQIDRQPLRRADEFPDPRTRASVRTTRASSRPGVLAIRSITRNAVEGDAVGPEQRGLI